MTNYYISVIVIQKYTKCELLKGGATVDIDAIKKRLINARGERSQNEVAKAKDRDLIPIGLGKRILRTETASGFVLSCLVYVTELGG